MRIHDAPAKSRRNPLRFAWRFACIASLVAGVIAFAVPRFATFDSRKAFFNSLNPFRVSVQETPLAIVDAQGIFVGSALSADGSLLAMATRSPAAAKRKAIELQTWNGQPGIPLRTLATIPDGHAQVHFSPNASELLVVTRTNILRFDVKTGRAYAPIVLSRAEVGDAAFSPDGKQLAFNTESGNVYVLSLLTGKVEHVIRPKRTYIPDKDGDEHICLAYSPNGATLAVSASYYPRPKPDTWPVPTGTLSIWDASTGICTHDVATGEFVVDHIGFTTDQSSVTAVGQIFGGHRGDGYYGASNVSDPDHGGGQYGVFNRDDPAVVSNFMSPDGLHFVAATELNLYVWQAQTPELQVNVPLPEHYVAPRTDSNAPDSPPVAIRFSGDGSTIAIDDTHRILLYRAHAL